MNNQPVKLATETQHLSPEALLVRDTLIKNGLENPMIENGLNNEQKYSRIKE